METPGMPEGPCTAEREAWGDAWAEYQRLDGLAMDAGGAGGIEVVGQAAEALRRFVECDRALEVCLARHGLHRGTKRIV